MVKIDEIDEGIFNGVVTGIPMQMYKQDTSAPSSDIVNKQYNRHTNTEQTVRAVRRILAMCKMPVIMNDAYLSYASKLMLNTISSCDNSTINPAGYWSSASPSSGIVDYNSVLSFPTTSAFNKIDSGATIDTLSSINGLRPRTINAIASKNHRAIANTAQTALAVCTANDLSIVLFLNNDLSIVLFLNMGMSYVYDRTNSWMYSSLSLVQPSIGINGLRACTIKNHRAIGREEVVLNTNINVSPKPATSAPPSSNITHNNSAKDSHSTNQSHQIVHNNNGTDANSSSTDHGHQNELPGSTEQAVPVLNSTNQRNSPTQSSRCTPGNSETLNGKVDKNHRATYAFLTATACSLGAAGYLTMYMPNAEVMFPDLDISVNYSHAALAVAGICAVATLFVWYLTKGPGTTPSTSTPTNIITPVTESVGKEEVRVNR